MEKGGGCLHTVRYGSWMTGVKTSPAAADTNRIALANDSSGTVKSILYSQALINKQIENITLFMLAGAREYAIS